MGRRCMVIGSISLYVSEISIRPNKKNQLHFYFLETVYVILKYSLQFSTAQSLIFYILFSLLTIYGQ